MTISAIVAMDENNGIGKDGKIPWFIKGEQLRFQTITMGHPVIMGRKTYQSIPDRFRPLKGRANIVITRDPHYNPQEEVHIVHSIDEALDLAKTLDNKEIFVIGGSQIFSSSFDKIDKLYITHVKGNYEADTFFPKIASSDWKQIEKEAREQFTFAVYLRADRSRQ